MLYFHGLVLRVWGFVFPHKPWETKIPNRTDKSDASGPLQGRADGSGRDRPEPKAENEVCLARPMQARTGGVKPGADRRRSDQKVSKPVNTRLECLQLAPTGVGSSSAFSSGIAPQRFGKNAFSDNEVRGPESLEGFGKVEKALGGSGFENADRSGDGEATGERRLAFVGLWNPSR
ncbi:MAG: hypothetical protein IT419_17700 [Planctomycetes bacterium]|nr:hypothetical protein [Planctomycetota bacterium]